MSGSGKGFLGLWLYKNGSDWEMKHAEPCDSQQPIPETISCPQKARASTAVEGERISVMFTLKNQVGGLVRVLSVFQDLGINVLHIESRKSFLEITAVSSFFSMQVRTIIM